MGAQKMDDEILVDELLEGVPEPRTLDYSKWDKIEDDDLWDRMVDASGIRRNQWRVVHTKVAVRERPSVNSKMIGMKKQGQVVDVEWALESLWLKLKDDGWMLAHGGDLGLGRLLVPT